MTDLERFETVLREVGKLWVRLRGGRPSHRRAGPQGDGRLIRNCIPDYLKFESLVPWATRSRTSTKQGKTIAVHEPEFLVGNNQCKASFARLAETAASYAKTVPLGNDTATGLPGDA